jgi:hypothetical protein
MSSSTVHQHIEENLMKVLKTVFDERTVCGREVTIIIPAYNGGIISWGILK